MSESVPPADSDTTVRAEVPPDETGPVPVEWTRAQPHYFGLTPPILLLALSAGASGATVALFVTGHWPLGLILLGVTILLLVLFAEVARRKPDTAVTRTSAAALDTLRARAAAAGEMLAARSRADREVRALRRELAFLAGSRQQLLLALGNAAYRGDDGAAADARRELEALDARAQELDARVREVVEEAQQRIGKARLEVQPTEMMDVVPEPYPPPDEGTPPAPAPVPEPYPPPDEGTPPAPEPVPEPGPGTPPPDQE
jgi:hypothetical protein